jgi:hypothetical protein
MPELVMLFHDSVLVATTRCIIESSFLIQNSVCMLVASLNLTTKGMMTKIMRR